MIGVSPLSFHGDYRGITSEYSSGPLFESEFGQGGTVDCIDRTADLRAQADLHFFVAGPLVPPTVLVAFSEAIRP